jgi:transglutaminase-like putative cysteine protease
MPIAQSARAALQRRETFPSLRASMRFRISHRTIYNYAGAASESFMEARLTPASDDRQRLLTRLLTTTPAANIHTYTDYFGNTVETFSIAQRHRELVLDSTAEVETFPAAPPQAALDISVSEARQLYRGDKLRLLEFLMPSPAIVLTSQVNRLANQFFKPTDALGPALLRLNSWIKENFRYAPGTTQIDTSVATALAQRSGVCQDFAQVMIATLRSAEIPARYATGYIETESQRQASEAAASDDDSTAPPPLIGASESHAWVEVCLPGGCWWPLDPTNDCVVGERHVRVAVGRDYHDCTPTCGVFKGTRTQRLSVAVHMTRL